MYIDPSAIIGKAFTVIHDSNHTSYTCSGYANCGTLIVIALWFDSVNNRSEIKTFKFNDVRFIGKI